MSAFCDTQNLELLDRQTDRQHGQCQKKTSEENKKKKNLKIPEFVVYIHAFVQIYNSTYSINTVSCFIFPQIILKMCDKFNVT